jgi:hypothetical protein
MSMLVDPPRGWMYGFPKVAPDNWLDMTSEEKDQWCIDEGYPVQLVDDGMLKHMRVIYNEKPERTRAD